MPNFTFHKSLGFWISIVTIILIFCIYRTLPLQPSDWKFWLLIPIIFFYSNVPDLDHHIGRLRKYTFQVLFICLVLCFGIYALFGITYTLLFVTLVGIIGFGIVNTKHRGPLHTYLFVFFISLPLIFLHWFLSIIAFISGSSHIMIDRIYSSIKKKVKRIFHIKENNKVVLFNINQTKVQNDEL